MKTICKKEIGTEGEDRLLRSNPEPVKAICDDERYFNDYFSICALLEEKEILLVRAREERKSFRKGRKSRERKALMGLALDSAIGKLNGLILKKEEAFWGEVERGGNPVERYLFENIAAKYGLTQYEKRVVLYLAYLKVSKRSRNRVLTPDLLNIMDLDNSTVKRMKDADSVSIKGRLLRQHILQGKENCFDEMELFLTERFFQVIVRALHGEVTDYDSEDVEEPDGRQDKRREVKVEDIGYVRRPSYSLKDVVVREEIKEKIRMFLDSKMQQAFQDLGFFERITKGKGMIFLFYGPPGTGKSILAEAVASEAERDMLCVEFPKITSRWFGETDKNISMIFRKAKEKNLVIVMDEADSLLYDRNYAGQEHDIRFVNVMLQELENYEGIIILTTNMSHLLDSALERRISLKVEFELPDEERRKQIWKTHIPEKVAMADDVDLAYLASRYSFSGGNIKNAVMNALRLMVPRQTNELTMEDLVSGADMEKEGQFSKRDGKLVKGFSQTFSS